MVTIKVLLTEGHAALRQALRQLLSMRPNVTVVGEARDGEETVEFAGALHPNVAVIDSALPPGLTGEETIDEVKHRSPKTRIVMLTEFESPGLFHRIVNGTITGCVRKSLVD